MEEREIEFVGVVFRSAGEVRVYRQFKEEEGYQYFIEEGGKIKGFEAFWEEGLSFRLPYPAVLDRWIDWTIWTDIRSVRLKEYEMDGRKLGEWWEKALGYYRGDKALGLWKEYWGLTRAERKALLDFFEKAYYEKMLIKNEWALLEFRKRILTYSLGEYMERLIEHFITRLFEVLRRGEEMPKNKAKGLLEWMDRHRGLDNASIISTRLGWFCEWGYLTEKEKGVLSYAIYHKLEEMAEKEEIWAGVSLEEWLELFKKELIARGKIKDTDKWALEVWKNWLRYYLNKREPEKTLDIVFRGNIDWDWMLWKEKRELAEKLMKVIFEEMEVESWCV